MGATRRMRAAAALLLAVACSTGGPAQPTALPTTPTPTATTRGSLAFVRNGEIRLRDAGGTVQVVTTLSEEDAFSDLAWSRDGRYVAWAHGAERFAFSVYEPATHRAGTWTGPEEFSAHRVGVTANGFVVVGEGSDSRMALFDPAEVLEGRGPRFVALPGLTRTHLLAAAAHRIVVGQEDDSRWLGPERVYDVTESGRATLLFTDNPPHNAYIGSMALTADGTRLVYAARYAVDECTFDSYVVVRDMRSPRQVQPVAFPGLPGQLWVVSSIVTGPDGRTTAAVTTDFGGCGAGTAPPVAFVLSGKTWRRLAPGATWAAGGRDGRLATLADDVLAIDAREVARDVTDAVWSPA